MIYAQLVYVYIFLPDLPQPGVSNAPRASHVIDSIIRYPSHPQPSPYPQPLMSYSHPRGGTVMFISLLILCVLTLTKVQAHHMCFPICISRCQGHFFFNLVIQMCCESLLSLCVA